MSTIRSEISTYFGKTVSGFVANKFRVDISAMNMETLRFYVKKVSIPYETLNFLEDVYVSDVTLAKPRNIMSVQTPSEITLTFRMDPENDIIKNLETLFYSTHNTRTYEVTRSAELVTVTVAVYGTDFVEKYSNTFNNCTLVKMENYDLDMSDRKLKEYSVTFLCNRISSNEYTSTSTSGNKAKVEMNCSRLLAKYKAALVAYKDSINSSKNTSMGLTKRDIDRAFSSSGVISVFYNLINNSAKCRFDEKFPIGMELSGTIRQYVYDALVYNKIPPDRISQDT